MTANTAAIIVRREGILLSQATAQACLRPLPQLFRCLRKLARWPQLSRCCSHATASPQTSRLWLCLLYYFLASVLGR